jgi:hypothetical protein
MAQVEDPEFKPQNWQKKKSLIHTLAYSHHLYLFIIGLEILSRITGQKNDIQIKKEDIKLPLFVDNMVLHMNIKLVEKN